MPCDRTLGYAIPDATAQAAQPAFPKGNLYMTMPDVIGPIFTNPDFVDLYHARGRPAEAPARLALVLVMMEIEPLSDAQAAIRSISARVCAVSHAKRSPPQAELTRKEVNGSPSRPDVETRKGKQHAEEAGVIQRHGGWDALQDPRPMAKAILLKR